MCAGLAGIAAEGAVATVVAAEVSQRQEDLFRISDDSGLESLPGFTGGCQERRKLVVTGTDQPAGLFTGE